MPFQRPPRPLSVLARALVAVGIVLAVTSCGGITPLGPYSAPARLPPPRHLGSPIIMQVMRSQPPTTAGQCPADSVDLFGSEPNVLRAAVTARPVGAPHPVSAAHPVGQARPVGHGSTVTPTATPTALPVGVACYRPVGMPVTITSAAVSSVATYPPPPDATNGPTTYGFLVAFPAADVATVTAIIKQAYDVRGAVGISVAGKLWEAPQVLKPFAGREVQITLLSRNQALQLHRLLVPPD